MRATATSLIGAAAGTGSETRDGIARVEQGRHPQGDGGDGWSRRDLRIVGGDGTVVWEQTGVEFPVAWSQQAAQIAASKYFWGAVRHVGAGDIAAAGAGSGRGNDYRLGRRRRLFLGVGGPHR